MCLTLTWMCASTYGLERGETVWTRAYAVCMKGVSEGTSAAG